MSRKPTLPAIVARNLDVEHVVFAACRWGCHAFGEENRAKRFALLVGADFHGDEARFSAMIDYLNHYDALDGGIQLGDIQPVHFGQDCSAYLNDVRRANKPFLPVLGNHDVGNSTDPAICGTQEEAYEKYVRPIEDRIGAAEKGSTRYLRRFDRHRVSVVVLDAADSPLDKDAAGRYAVPRGTTMLSQEQADWFARTLAAVPQGDHLIVALHAYPHACHSIDGVFTDTTLPLSPLEQECPYLHAGFLGDIVHAWKNGGACKKEYAPSPRFEKTCPPVRVDCDFSGRGRGDFVAYVAGHYHRDACGADDRHPDQTILTFAASAADLWQNGCCDLPRAAGSKAQDALTVMSVDTEKRKVYLVRVGSNTTTELTDRTRFVFSY